MKKKILALFLCCVMVAGLLPGTLATAFAAETELKVNADTVWLKVSEMKTLTADAGEVSGSYQWQIQTGAGAWVNILGANGKTLTLSYGLVASLLRDNAAKIRCRMTTDADDTLESNVVTVQIQHDAAAANAPAASPAVGMVTTEAKALGEPVVTFEQSPESDETADEAPVPTTYTILINYVFENGEQAAPSWSATVATGSTFAQDIQSPVVVGYTPDQEVVEVNASVETIYKVIYYPARVDFTVTHYQQNVSDDNYTLVDTETKQGYTKSPVGNGLAKTTYSGFYSLLYDTATEVAADGSTVVEIRYDRYYYLMNFDLGGGYGVEPIYARYGAAISVGTPTRPGFTFTGWNETIPSTMPAGNTTFTAKWETGTSGFTVVFWYENADDDGYSVAGTYTPANVAPGTTVSSGSYQNYNFTGRDTQHFTYNAAKAETVTVKGDSSTVLNVYFTRNTYTLTFKGAGEKVLNCGKTEHSHSDDCCKYGGTSLSHWRHRDSCCKLGLSEHTHSDSCYKTQDLLITAKYDSNISVEFSKAPFNTTYNGRAWECTDSSKFSYAFQTLDRMPGFDATFNLYDKSSNTKKTIYYYVQKVGTTVSGTRWPTSTANFDLLKQVDTYFNFATYDEEYHEIQGFTRYSASVAGFSNNNRKDFSRNNTLNLYYLRNSYNLKFYNHDGYVTSREATVQYEAPLSGYDFTPDYPANLEKNAYVFAGWYTTAGCFEGSEANLSTMTMPASDVILYAKWTPKFHTVSTYLTKDAMDGTPLGTWENVPHGTSVAAPATPVNGNYTFVGWFYISDTGEEKAFDFSMPVNRDLDLYAKWSSNTLMTYTIRYELEDGTEIAPPTTGSALAGSTKTFNAKTGTELDALYRSGYFPKVSSHSLTIDIDDTSKNEFTFVYVAKAEVEYTVRYLDRATGKPVVVNGVPTPDKKVTTRYAVVTETFQQITGYAPDAYQKQLVLAADGNEIIFWYVKDEAHAPVHIIHWTQNIAGDGYTQYQSSTNLNGVIGTSYSETPLTIPGFAYNADPAHPVDGYPALASGELTAAGLVLNLYYDRIEYPYEFRFLEQGTEKVLANPVTGNARYQAQVTQKAKDIPGYTLVSAENQSINIKIENGKTAVKNVATFYYTEQMVDIKYVVVGPTGCGTLDNYQEAQLRVMTGEVKGSTPTANPGFKFVGWYTTEDCVFPVEDVVPGSVDPVTNKLTPQKRENGCHYEWTYYAKFEYDVADLTITKTGWETIDENQSFIFKVVGPNNFEKTVVINKGGSVIIKGLKIGAYTVTEMTGWSWRYEPDGNSKTITLQPAQTNEVTFANTRSNDRWLGGDDYRQNKFGS